MKNIDITNILSEALEINLDEVKLIGRNDSLQKFGLESVNAVKIIVFEEKNLIFQLMIVS